MSFKMKFGKTDLKKPEPEPNGIYTLRLVGFKPQLASSGESYNLNPVFEFPDKMTSKGTPKQLWYACSCNTSKESAQIIQDFVHCGGEIMEEDPNDPNGEASMPGVFDTDKAKFDPTDPKTWLYSGPLLNKLYKVELYTDNWQGRLNNKILRFFCAVPNCAERFPQIQHSDNLNWGKKK